MFTIRCTTCDARLAVKSDDLVGQILACPKCGGMVLVQRPEDEATLLDLALDDDPTPQLTRFPDAASYETDSGIMKPDEVEKLLGSVLPKPPVVLTDSEIRARKILLGLLVGLLLLLVVAVGILVTVKKNNSVDIPETNEHVAEAPLGTPLEPEKRLLPATEPAKEAPNVEDDKTEEMVLTEEFNPEEQVPEKLIIPKEQIEDPEKEERRDLLASLLSRTPEIPPVTETSENELGNVEEKTTAEIRSTTDLLASLQRKMPGLIDPKDVISVDIPARLAIPLAGLKLENAPLSTVLQAMTALTEIPVTLDVDEFRCRGIRVDTPLTGQYETGTVGNVLTKLLIPLELEPVIEDRQILITISEQRRNKISERKFNVADLAEKSDEPLTPELLADILRRLVDPGGDRSSITVDGNMLVVRHRLRILDESLRVLEQLRVIRGLPQTTDVTGEHLAPEAFGWDAVIKPMTLNYYQPTSLAGVLKQLEERAKLRIVVDHRALNRALCPLGTMKATVRCNRGTINEALESLLSSVDVAMLTYRIVDYDVLEITTSYAARQPDKMSIEVHRYETQEKPLTAGETPESLVRTIRSALEPTSWYKPDDPETVGLGDIIIDRPSGCLLVRQSQPMQRQLRLWLGKKLSARVPEDTETSPVKEKETSVPD